MVILNFFTALFQEVVLFFSKPLGFGGHFTSVNIIIWSVYIGIIAAALISVYNRQFLGKYVNKLLDNKALSPESAISPMDSGHKNIFLKHALKKGVTFRKIVVSANAANETDILKQRYYISEGNRERAKNLYAKNGASLFFVILSAILLLAVVALLYNTLPDIIEMAENFFGSFKIKDNIA